MFIEIEIVQINHEADTYDFNDRYKKEIIIINVNNILSVSRYIMNNDMSHVTMNNNEHNFIVNLKLNELFKILTSQIAQR